MALIEVENLHKEFKVYKRQKGFANTMKALVSREFEMVQSVKGISFSVNPGELIGYVGSNGAGKSTTIKMLSGIVVPTSGRVMVNGIEPYKNRKQNAKQIGVVFGQRSQLNWDLPCNDTFDLYKRMYKIETATFKRNVELCVELLAMQDFIHKPVRQLSLGQKMRAEIAVSLLHDPSILYLDEPTIGLDVDVKDRIRKFAKVLRDEKNTTILLTTHDMDDIDEICERIIMIDKGEILVDRPLADYKRSFAVQTYFELEFAGSAPDELDPRFELTLTSPNRIVCKCQKEAMPIREAMVYFSSHFDLIDVKIRSVELDEIVRDFYQTRQA